MEQKTLDDDERIRRWKADELATLLGTTRITTLRSFIPAMLEAGVLHRPGGARFWWGSARDVIDWVCGRFLAATIKKGVRP
jgi:hypothetical protein